MIWNLGLFVLAVGIIALVVPILVVFIAVLSAHADEDTQYIDVEKEASP